MSTPKTTTCKDCDGTISKQAKTCPHCGARGPSILNAEYYAELIKVGLALMFLVPVLFIGGTCAVAMLSGGGTTP